MSEMDKKLAELLALVADTCDDEIDCDEFLSRIAGYVEQIAEDPELGREFLSIARHLQICPECKEEFEALLKLHQSE